MVLTLLPQTPPNKPPDPKQIFCSFDLLDPDKDLVSEFVIPIIN